MILRKFAQLRLVVLTISMLLIQFVAKSQLTSPNSIIFLENTVNSAFEPIFPVANSSYANSGTPNFTGTNLSVAYVNQAGSGVTGVTTDQLGVKNVGTGTGQVNVVLGSPNTVKVGSTTVATYPSSLNNSGVSGENLVITWVGSPTLAQVNAVLNQIGYQTTSDNPNPARYIKLTIIDGSNIITFNKLLTVTAENDAPRAGASTVRSDITAPSDPIIIWPAGSTTPGSEGVANAIDNNTNTKYLNWGSGSAAPPNSGFVVTPASGATIVTKLTFVSANDESGRDPITYKLEGSRDGGGSYTTIVNSANTNVSTSRFTSSESAEFSNQEWYSSYRLTFPQLRSAGAMMQIGEVELLGVPFQRVVYTIGSSSPVLIHNLLSVTDVDNSDQIQSATVNISTNFNANDVLTWTNQSGITGSYNASTGLLSFTGSAAPSVYQTLLRSVKFNTAAPNSAGKQRLITFQVVDAAGLTSNLAEARVVVSFPPTLTAVTSLGTANRSVANSITYAMLSSASQDFTDADTEDVPLKFKIKSIGTNGTLTKGGVAVSIGDVVATGESLVWTPSTTTSNVVVMSVRAFDGDLESSANVNVTMNVQNLPAPIITSFTPTTAGQGETVVITGSNFSGSTVVKFGNVNATSFVVNSNTQITAVVGAAASGDVYVQNPTGNDTESGFLFKVVELKFDGNTLDQTAAARNGTIVGTATYGTGASGQAICFNNNNVVNGTSVQNYLTLPSDLIRGRGSNFTISLRFKTNSYGGILGYQNAAAGSVNKSQWVPILYVQSDGKLNANLWQGSVLNVTSTSRVDDGNWHKVEFSAAPGSITVYIDGVLVGTSTGTIDHLSMTFNQLGAVTTEGVWTGDPIDGWFGFNGCIDEFMIIDKSLTATQIQQVTQLPLPTITSFSPTTAKSGETITITGTNLGSASSVKIGGVEARRFTVVSATEITAIVPKNATVNNTILVTTAAGTSSTTTFTFDCTNLALNFDATNDHVVIGDKIENLGAFSQEAWVYWKGSSRQDYYNEIFAKEFISSFSITNSNELHANFGDGTSWGAGLNSSTLIPLNTWTHVAITRSTTGLVKLYINGVLDANTATLNKTGANAEIRAIGAKPSGNTRYGHIDGAIDELKIWNTERTAQQIQLDLADEAVGDEAGLISYYNFNQGTAAGTNTTLTTLNNLTPSANLNGTLTNFSLTGATSNFVQGVWPVVTVQPIATSTVCAGNVVSLSTTAAGPQLTYQWYTNTTASNTGGTAITGANAATYTFTSSTVGTKYFYVVVNGACSRSTTSNVSTVNTTAVPVISYVSTYGFERTIAINNIVPTTSGAVVASYVISPTLPQGLSFNTTTGVISGTPEVNSTAIIYTVTGTAASGCSTAATFTLEVFSAVAPSAMSYAPASQTVRQGTAITAMVPSASGGVIASYSISPALPAGLIFNTTTGEITGTLTAAQTGATTHTITATNSGGSTTATITLIYNTAPTDLSVNNASVAENAASGTTVGTLSATDADAGDSFTYALVSGTGDTDNASFTIDGSTLKTAAVFDFETKSSYSVRVRVTDAGGLSFEKALTISITNVNEAPTNISASASSVLENAALGTNVASFSTTDTDANDTFTYTLVSGTGSTDNASFTIVGNSIRTAAVFDFETKSSYSVRVRVTDAGGLTFEKAFTITVTDVNEAPTLTAITDRRVYNVATSQIVNLAGITAGPETAQTTTTSVSTSNPSAFSAINVAGTQIQFTLAAGIATPQDIVVTVRVKDNGGVANGGVDSLVRTFRLGIDPMPVASASPNLITLGATAQLSATGANAVNYTWVAVGGTGIVGSGASINVRPRGTTTYAVVVTNSFGYQATIPVLLTVIVDYKLVPNNLVTPNGDGVNDKWVIPNIDMYPDNEVMVYDKAGRAVFAKRGYNNEWDGTVNGKLLKEDAYFYVIKFNKDGALPIRGYVSIVR